MMLKKIHNATKVITLLTVGLLSSLQAKDRELTNFEPFPLTEKTIKELTTPAKKQSKTEFSLKGIKLKGSFAWGEIQLAVQTDQRLNLWTGWGGDSSGHLGKMQILIKNVKDQEDNNVYDNSKEREYQKRITIYHKGDKIFKGSRSVAYKKGLNKEEIKSISGTIELRLPVGFKKYTLIKGYEAMLRKIEKENKDITKIELVEKGLKIDHPTSLINFEVVIMGFNKESERLKIMSAGSAGSDRDNHYYYYGNDATYKKIDLFTIEEYKNYQHSFYYRILRKNLGAVAKT